MSQRQKLPVATVNQFGAALLAAVGLTMVYWWQMWLGDGLIGGDIMDYFFPQKVYLANALADGQIPLWNNLVNLGYPFVADSQIALWYPTTIPLYSLMPVETAFQTNIVIHYVIAFLFTWAYCRAVGVRQGGALLAALAFTYGWFPPRLSVEWAITTGCYLPGLLWCAERFLQLGEKRWIAGLATLGALQLLAGHFSLAFISHVILGIYVVCRLTVARRPFDASSGMTAFAWLIAAQVVAFPLAGAQLAPTWELRQQSNRGGLPIPGVDEGRIPWNHTPQIVMPWIAYHNDMSEYPPPYTNGPAASLFIGVIPFGFALWGFAVLRRRHAAGRIWRIAIPIAVVFAVGWMTDIYKYLPGFGFFKIPGRYSLIAAIGLATLSGVGFDRAMAYCRAKQIRPGSVGVIVASLVLITLVDLYVYGRSVAFTSFVPLTIDEILAESELPGFADVSSEPLRMMVSGNNALTCTGIAAVPGFLGLAPDPYVDEAAKIPTAADPDGPVASQLKLMQRYGVTHIIFDRPFDRRKWDVTSLGPMQDAFLSRVMNRYDPTYGPNGGIRPFELAAVPNTRGRAAVIDSAGEIVPDSSSKVTAYEPNRVEIEVVSPEGATAVLTDLTYPGWEVAVDGQPAIAGTTEGLFRSVEIDAGVHRIEWLYRPRSVPLGWIISLVTAVLFAGGLYVGSRRT